ncbi:hypothetical protein ES703_72170 [subsurface metagenome]
MLTLRSWLVKGLPIVGDNQAANYEVIRGISSNYKRRFVKMNEAFCQTIRGISSNFKRHFVKL